MVLSFNSAAKCPLMILALFLSFLKVNNEKRLNTNSDRRNQGSAYVY